MAQDCTVLPGEAVAKQHKLVQTKYRRKENKIKKTKWWKLNDEEHRKNFVRTVNTRQSQRISMDMLMIPRCTMLHLQVGFLQHICRSRMIGRRSHPHSVAYSQ